MPVTSGDMSLRLTGGASNSNPNLSLGGVKSSISATGTLFDATSNAERVAGDVEYRCVAFQIAVDATIVKAWLSANTPAGDTDAAIGLGTSALSGTEQVIANEDTAPTGVTFSAAGNLGAALDLGVMTPGSWRNIWIRRTINANAAAVIGDGFTLRIEAE